LERSEWKVLDWRPGTQALLLPNPAFSDGDGTDRRRLAGAIKVSISLPLLRVQVLISAATYRFIQNHFADSFKLHTDSPPSMLGKNQEEKWISAATLLDPSTQSATPQPEPPKTPEPKGPFIPSFSLLTPTGHSPRSIPSSSPSLKTGSPLTALQYMRKAGPDPNLRPGTPTKAPLRARNTPTANIGRPGVWRP
jgi:hypothetical protein